MTGLADRDITTCQDNPEPLSREEITDQLDNLPEWEYVDGRHIERQYSFPDFKQALAFVQKVGADAEARRHHPVIKLSWGKTVLRYRTHDVDAVTEADLIMAARADRIYDT